MANKRPMANRPNGENWRHGRARKQLEVKDAAEILGISPGYLRNIETEQPMAKPSLLLAYRAAALYGLHEDLIKHPKFGLIRGDNNDGVPDEPPGQPQPAPPPPPRRRGGDDNPRPGTRRPRPKPGKAQARGAA